MNKYLEDNNIPLHNLKFLSHVQNLLSSAAKQFVTVKSSRYNANSSNFRNFHLKRALPFANCRIRWVVVCFCENEQKALEGDGVCKSSGAVMRGN